MREIVLNVFLKGKAKSRDLMDDFGMPSSTLSLYLTKLVNQGILERWRIGRENVYTVKYPECAINVLTSYQDSFDESVRTVCKSLNTWMTTQSPEHVHVNYDEFGLQHIILPR
jgi:DNA-binding HxlR family transcriptional regulator